MKLAALLVLVVVASSCRSSARRAQAPSAPPPVAVADAETSEAEEPEAEEPEAQAAKKLPDTCAKPGADVCTPSEAFVKRLCQNSFPSVALALMRKGTPFTRGYLTRKTKAWNASGGASDSSELEFDEEVLVLRHRAADLGGMQVSGAGGGFDALRWNGSCVTLAKEELTLRLPPRAKHARVEWRFLDESIQEQLRKDEKVDQAYKKRRGECKGATMGTVSLKCVKADARLSDVIVDYARSGGTVPKPDKLP